MAKSSGATQQPQGVKRAEPPHGFHESAQSTIKQPIPERLASEQPSSYAPDVTKKMRLLEDTVADLRKEVNCQAEANTFLLGRIELLERKLDDSIEVHNDRLVDNLFQHVDGNAPLPVRDPQ